MNYVGVKTHLRMYLVFNANSQSASLCFTVCVIIAQEVRERHRVVHEHIHMRCYTKERRAVRPVLARREEVSHVNSLLLMSEYGVNDKTPTPTSAAAAIVTSSWCIA